MNYMRFKVEDFIMDESFQQYCSGTNPVAEAFWEQWQKEHPEKGEQVQIAKKLYLQLNGGIDATLFATHQDKFNKALLEQGIQQPKNAENGNTAKVVGFRSGWKWLIGAAAALLAGVIITFLLKNGTSPSSLVPVEQALVYSSNAGERKSFQLPDGSKVVLNAGSSLTLEKDFNKTERSLTLQGEAFFDVTHNASLPFVIHTEGMDIRVLGTAFNVKAYPDDATSETSLVHGLVEVFVKGPKPEKVLLHPNEKVVIGAKPTLLNNKDQLPNQATTRFSLNNYTISTLTHLSNDSTTAELSWIDNKLIFSDEPLGEIVKKLERWYNVEISIESAEIAQYKFTGTFNKENLGRVLEIMKVSRDFNFKFKSNRHIILSK